MSDISPDPTNPTPVAPDAAATGDADLSHLHPDNLRLGGIGVFAGDWAWITHRSGPPRIPVGFVGLLIDTWNGWAVFACTRDVAEAIVADQQRVRDAHRDTLTAQGLTGPQLTARLDESTGRLHFDGDDVVLDERGMHDGDPAALCRITPRPDGRYVIGGWSWCWQPVDPTDCDRIAGYLPPAGEHQEYVVLTHTPDMTVPHGRVQISSLVQMPTRDGVAFRADVSLDGRYVGTLENDGPGGSTDYRAINSSLFNEQHLHEFVAGSRRRGEPVTTEQLLHALIDEFEVTWAVTRAERDGAVMVRLLDEDGHTLTMLDTRPVPTNAPQRVALIRWLAAHHPHPAGAQWEMWSGTAWRHLARIHPGGDTSPEGKPDG